MSLSIWQTLHRLLTYKCQDTTRALSDQLEGDPGWVARWAALGHLLSCTACRRFRRQLAFLQQVARRRTERVQVDPARLAQLTERLERLIQTTPEDPRDERTS